MPEPLVLAFHNSDIIKFKKCRRAWDITSDLRQGLKPIVQPQPLSFGTAVHAGFQTYYEPATWDLTKDPVKRQLIIENAITAFKDEVKSAKDRYLQLSGQPSLEEVMLDKYYQDLDLGEGMLRHYFDYVYKHNMDRFTPVAVELGFQVDLWTPEEIATMFPKLPQGTRVVFKGRIDLLLLDEWGEYWIWDHKTTARLKDTMPFLELDEQLGSYNWALQIKNGIKIAGNIYSETLKAYPKPLTLNKSRRLGCLYSVSKSTASTTYEIALAQLKEAGEDLEPYKEFLHWLKEEGPQFVQRTPVYRNQHELADIGNRIRMEVQDMLNDPHIYPNPDMFKCGYCESRQVCIAMNDGSDVDFITKEYFIKEKRTNA